MVVSEPGSGIAVDRPLERGAPRGEALGSWFAAVAFVLLSGPVGVPTRISTAGLAVVGTIALWRRWTSAHDVYIPSWCILFAAWCVISLLWSDDPAETLINGTSLALLMVAAVTAANAFSARSIVRGVVYGAVVAAVLSLGEAVVAPAQGVSHDVLSSGALQGIYAQRNILASVMALGLVTAVSGAWALRSRPVLRFLPAALLAACTIAAQSITAVASLLATFTVVLALAAVRRLRGEDRALAFVGLGALVAVGVTLLDKNLVTLLESFGKDPTLTGRTIIWRAVWTQITERPWLGHGWGAVWGVGDPAGNYVRSYIGFSIDHSHNGALDVLIQAGAVGLFLLLAALTEFAIIAGRAYFRGPTQLGIWPLALLAVVLFYDVSESEFSPPSSWWFIVVVAVVLVLREAALVPSPTARWRVP